MKLRRTRLFQMLLQHWQKGSALSTKESALLLRILLLTWQEVAYESAYYHFSEPTRTILAGPS